ncbi:hypothetical protein Glove_309g23 [Diversispora epigaea]|uniref:Uncharacterized protein n=1 Tax=Diversispora epigaea TaxID=1348612 RepID=A0A397HS76_9GLOM|nr:hypothetical protein Glove_309g23 [Diversispora epigaea]
MPSEMANLLVNWWFKRIGFPGDKNEVLEFLTEIIATITLKDSEKPVGFEICAQHHYHQNTYDMVTGNFKRLLRVADLKI